MRRRPWCPDSVAMLLIGAVAPTALAAGPDRSSLSAHGNWRIANAHIANGSLPAAERQSWDRAMGQCNATLIVGTGRAGTSFLVALLTRLGLPTGFTNADVDKTLLHTAAHAGLEHDPRMMDNYTIQCSPKLQIFKSPRLTEPEKVAQWINARNIQVSPGSPLAASPPSPPTPGPCPLTPPLTRP